MIRDGFHTRRSGYVRRYFLYNRLAFNILAGLSPPAV